MNNANSPFFNEHTGVKSRDYCAMFLYLERMAQEKVNDVDDETAIRVADRSIKDADLFFERLRLPSNENANRNPDNNGG